MKIKVLFKAPNKNFEEVEITNTLEDMQKLVDGYIEVIPTDIYDKVFMIVNEEGKLYELEPNIHYYRDIILGNVVFVRIGNNGEWSSISDKQIAAIKKYFGMKY